MPTATMGQVILGRKGRRVVVDTGSVLLPSTFDPANKSSDITLSNGNRTATKADTATGVMALVRSLSAKSTGKWHVEFAITTAGGTDLAVGLATAGVSMTGGSLRNSGAVAYIATGGGIWSGGGIITAGDAYTTGDTVAFEWDADAGNFYVQKLGGTRQGPFSTPGGAYFFAVQFTAANTGQVITVNAGQSAFAITPTAGYSAWSQ